jgi:hypothetical protein
VPVGEGCCRRAHRTVRWCTKQSLFTVRCTICTCSDFCARSPCTVAHCSPFADDRWCCSRYSAWHTGQSGATPDSPVNYSGEAIPETQRWQVQCWSPWCTEHCPVAHRTVRCARPRQPSVFFAPLIWTLSFNFVLVCCEPLAPVKLIIYSKLVSPIIRVGQFNHQNHLGKGVSLFPFQSPPFWWLMPTQTKANI